MKLTGKAVPLKVGRSDPKGKESSIPTIPSILQGAFAVFGGFKLMEINSNGCFPVDGESSGANSL